MCIQAEIDLVTGTQVSVNFSAVQLTAAKASVEAAIYGDLPRLVSVSLAQFSDVENSVNESMAPTTGDVKDTCKQAEADISSTVSGFNDTINSIDIQSIQDMVNYLYIRYALQWLHLHRRRRRDKTVLSSRRRRCGLDFSVRQCLFIDPW